MPDHILVHISPAHSENVNFFGIITVDVEAELAKLDAAGWRLLRRPPPLDLWWQASGMPVRRADGAA